MKTLFSIICLIFVTSAFSAKNLEFNSKWKNKFPTSEGIFFEDNNIILSVVSIPLIDKNSIIKSKKIADENAKKQIADFINSIVESKTKITIESTTIQNKNEINNKTLETFSQIIRSESKAFLKGIYRVASWESDSSEEVYVAVVADPNIANQTPQSTYSLTKKNELKNTTDPTEIIVVGIATYIPNNVEGSRVKALEDALNNAVEMAVGAFIETDTITKNMSSIKQHIYSNTDGFVSKYEITDENKKNDEYEVVIKAIVEMGKVKNELTAIKLLTAKLANLKVMLLLKETMDGKPKENSDLINLCENKLLDKGITLIDQGQLKAVLADMEPNFLEECMNNPDKAANFARTQGAEVIIVGKNVLKYIGKDPEGFFDQVTALVNIKAINASTARIYGTATQSKDGVDTSIDGAAQLACKRVVSVVVDEMMPRVLRSWQDEVNNGFQFKVILQGVSKFKLVKKFKNALKEVPGVKAVDQRSYNRSSKRLELDVIYKGNPNDFIDESYESVSEVTEFEEIEPSQKGGSIVFLLPS